MMYKIFEIFRKNKLGGIQTFHELTKKTFPPETRVLSEIPRAAVVFPGRVRGSSYRPAYTVPAEGGFAIKYLTFPAAVVMSVLPFYNL